MKYHCLLLTLDLSPALAEQKLQLVWKRNECQGESPIFTARHLPHTPLVL
jgi:hypothetical protein